MSINLFEQIKAAHDRIKPFLKPTPLIPALHLSKQVACEVYLKLENLQPTNSFKVRGAFNKLLCLNKDERDKGIVTASTGNHGAAVAYASNLLNIKNLIFVPENASETKLANIKSFGGIVQQYGKESGITETHARKFAAENNMIYISPYNDAEIIAGQGTISIELFEQCSGVDVILAPVGGGGLIAGIANYAKVFQPDIHILGSLPQNSPVMAACIAKGHPYLMSTLPTLSDATAGNMDLDSLTFPLCQTYVDDYLLVSEEAIKAAIINLLSHEHLLVEGAVGTTIAALINNKARFENQKVVLIISGANISLKLLKEIIS